MSSAGHVIQVPLLEKGDRLVVVESPRELPLQLLVSYLDQYEDTKSVRYVLMEELPDELRQAISEFIKSKTS